MIQPYTPTGKPMKLAVLFSGGGRTMDNIASHIDAGKLNASIVAAVSSRADSKGLAIAAKRGIESYVLSPKDSNDNRAFSEAIFKVVRERGADMVCLAGFLSLLIIPDDFAHQVVNIHPALLPAFGGKGMYGTRVHQAVLHTGCKITGCTVHFCDQTYDTGPIIVQRACEVCDADTADTLAARVFEQECIAYPHALQLIAEGRVKIDGRCTRIQ